MLKSTSLSLAKVVATIGSCAARALSWGDQSSEMMASTSQDSENFLADLDTGDDELEEPAEFRSVVADFDPDSDAGRPN